jgi:chloride channel 7
LVGPQHNRIIENDLFNQDWRSRSNVEVLQYIFLKWAMAFLVGLLTGVIASLINLAIENISGLKMLHMVTLVREKRYWAGFLYFAGVNFALTFVAAVLCVVFAPTAAGPGIPEIKAYLNGVDTPNMFGAPQLIVKVQFVPILESFFLIHLEMIGDQQTTCWRADHRQHRRGVFGA